MLDVTTSLEDTLPLVDQIFVTSSFSLILAISLLSCTSIDSMTPSFATLEIGSILAECCSLETVDDTTGAEVVDLIILSAAYRGTDGRNGTSLAAVTGAAAVDAGAAVVVVVVVVLAEGV